MSGVFSAKTYKEHGIPERQARRWQAIARIPEVVFDRHIDAVKEEGKELTTQGVLLLARSFSPRKTRRRRRNSIVDMTPADIEALCGESSKSVTLSVYTVGVCGRQIVISGGQGSVVIECTSKRMAGTFAGAAHDALTKKPVKMELHPGIVEQGKEASD